VATNNRPRTYQGRQLPRPGDELVDQGLSFDVGTLVSRRGVLGLFGLGVAGAAGLSLAACGASASSSPGATASASSSSGLTEIPDETNGPYPADGTNGPDILEDSGVIRKDITSSFGTSTTKAEGGKSGWKLDPHAHLPAVWGRPARQGLGPARPPARWWRHWRLLPGAAPAAAARAWRAPWVVSCRAAGHPVRAGLSVAWRLTRG